MNTIRSLYETLMSVLSTPVVSGNLMTVKLGNLLLGALLFIVGLKLIRFTIHRYGTWLTGKWIHEEEVREWLQSFVAFILILVLLIISFSIAGFPFSALGRIWVLTLFTIKDSSIRVGNIILGILLFYPGIKFAKYLSREFQTLFLKRLRLDLATRKSLEALTRYLLIIIVVLFVLTIVGIPLTAFTLIGGAVAIGIGLGSQNLVNNFLSGVVLMTERPLKVGDIVELENRRGTVEHIGGRSTRIKTLENVRMVIPNSKLLENTVINWSLIDNFIRREVVVGVAYGSPVKQVRDLMYKAAAEEELIEADPEPTVLFSDYGDNALIFTIMFWIKVMPGVYSPYIIESNLRFRIYEAFLENGITIAYPQRDVHLDSLKPVEVKVISEPVGPGPEKPPQ